MLNRVSAPAMTNNSEKTPLNKKDSPSIEPPIRNSWDLRPVRSINLSFLKLLELNFIKERAARENPVIINKAWFIESSNTIKISELEVKIPANINITNMQCKKQKKDTAAPAEFNIIENLLIVIL